MGVVPIAGALLLRPLRARSRRPCRPSSKPMLPDHLLSNWRSLYGAPPDVKSVIDILRGDCGDSAPNRHSYRSSRFPSARFFGTK